MELLETGQKYKELPTAEFTLTLIKLGGYNIVTRE